MILRWIRLLHYCRLCVALLLLSGSVIYSQSEVQGEARIWHKQTLFFDGPDTSEADSYNPFLNYRLNVYFTAPSGNTFIVPGYYAADGNAAESSASSGNKWAVHFTPNEIGSWSYEVSFRKGDEIAVRLDPNAGTGVYFDGTSGHLEISENDKTFPDNRAKGRLNYVGSRYLKWEGTNTYFIKVGADSPENILAHKDFDNSVTTKDWSPHIGDWNPGDPVWKEDKGKGLIGAINYLASKGMNTFSFNIFNLDDPETNNNGGQKTIWPWSSTDIALLEGSGPLSSDSRMRYDVSKLAQWEVVFNHGDQKGMFLHFKTQERGNLKLLNEGYLGIERMLYYREIIARFGHHLAMNWNLGEEFHIYDPSLINALSSYIKAIDPYDHPIVLHSFPGQQDRLYEPVLGTTSGLTGVSIQMDIDLVHTEVKKWSQASEQSGHPWIVSNDEQGHWKIGVTVDEDYEGNHGSQPDNRDEVRHKILWGTLMAGGFGAEYYFGTETGETDWASENWRSRETKWEDAKIALDFFETHLEFWEMKNQDALTSSDEDYCFTDLDNTYVIFLPGGETTEINLGENTQAYSIRWYDPRRGGSLMPGSVTEIDGSGYKAIGFPPYDFEHDWVALLKKNTEESNVPITALTISPSQVSLEVGEHTFLNVVTSPTHTSGTKLIWSSNDPSICTVEANGKVVALAEGTAIITVQNENGDLSDSAYIHIEDTPEMNLVSGFTLINTATNSDLMSLTEGQVIPFSDIKDLDLSIRANTYPIEVGSVYMNLSGPLNKERTENIAPYTLFGNSGEHYLGANLPAGNYHLSAIAYSEENSGGEPGPTMAINFIIKSSSAQGKFTMVDTASGTDLFLMEDKMVINWEALYNKRVSIRANVEADTVESVSFSLKGPVERNHVENGAPYTLFGDVSGNYQGQKLSAGNYVLNATAYTGEDLTGNLIEDTSLQFTIEQPDQSAEETINVTLSGDIMQNPDVAENFGLTLHPNPASGHVKADLWNPDNAITKVFIYDMAGSLVHKHLSTPGLKKNEGGQQIDTSSLTSGIYLVKVFTEAFETYHYKLIVNAN
ncbi:MAG: DUF5060 domain-containing protein [Flavobacteriaceae bacterium]